MSWRRLRNWRPLWGATAAVIAIFWLLYELWQVPPKNRNDLAIFGAFALPVVVLAAGWLQWAWRRARASPADSEELDRAAGRLAAAVYGQWQQAAGERGLAGADSIQVTWGRPSLPLAGPLRAAVGSRRFDPLPGLAPAGTAQLAAGRISDLHAVYGGLGSGRLVIAGPPGSGKSGAAVLLVLAALRHREQVPDQDKPSVPVLVLVTAQDWNPRHQPVADWLTRRLQETYPQFAGAAGAATAAGLIAAGKIAVILDGLDEIAADLQPIALQALSQQVTFRVVVLSRTAEMASAASRRGVLQGAAAIELRAVDPAEAASYLERVQLDPPPDGWHDLIHHIRTDPASPLTRALDSPLTLTLVRDTYQSGDDARELLGFCDTSLHGIPGHQATEAITGHLLDRVLPAAYARRPGQPPPPYDLPAAQNALIRIAARMNQDGTRDLQWWRIPTWVPHPPRGRLLAVIGGLIGGLVGGPVGGLVVGLICGVMHDLGHYRLSANSGPPHRVGKLRARKALTLENLVFGLMFGLMFGLIFGLVAGLVRGLVVGLVFGLASGLVAGLVLGLADALAADPESISSLSPVASWHADLKFGLVVGFAFGLMIGLAVWSVAGPVVGLADGLVVGLVVGLGLSGAWPASLTAVQLAFRWRTPVRLVRFLDDACNRNVLRTVGPAYQFRHARLQDRLAAATAQITTT